MPTYAYHCQNCGHQHEVLQKITEMPLKTCPSCKKDTLQRGPGGGIGLSFTGSGFYATDYGTSARPPENSGGASTCCPCGKNKGSCNS